MKIHSLTSPPPPNLAGALEEFEYSFLYPLGPKQKFRISHGREYLPFFRAMGEATLLVAQHAGTCWGRWYCSADGPDSHKRRRAGVTRVLSV